MTELSSFSRKDPEEDDARPLQEARLPFATSRSVFALMLREMATSYGRSPGGYIWAVVEPAAGIAVLTAVFSIGFRNPPLGTSFPLFYATGILVFLMYADIAGKMSQTLNYSRALLEYPRVTFVDALIARFILNMITQFMVHFLIMGLILSVFVSNVHVDLGKMVYAYVTMLLMAIGVGTLNSFLTVAYPVWQTIWAVMNRPIFLVSCIFFLYESIPHPYRDYLWFNPLAHPIGLMRDAFYPYYNPTYVTMSYPLLCAAVLTLVGLFLLNRYHRDILDK